MTVYGGIDLHSNNSYIGIVDEENQVIFKRRSATISLLLSALAPLKNELQGSRWNRPSTGTGSSMGYSMPAIPSISPIPLQ